jgi:predicted glycosyltransferase
MRRVREKKRVLFYVHDRIGIGHLRKMSKLAAHLADEFACAIICGHRNVDWIIPDCCEYFHIPGLAKLIPAQSEARGRSAWLPLSSAEARDFRSGLIASIASIFEPDVMVVEHFPLGLNDELESILEYLPCAKVFSTSGLLTAHDQKRSNIFNPRGIAAIRTLYSKVFVTTDPKVVDIGERYDLPEAIRGMVEPVGYLSERLSPDIIGRVRTQRGLTGMAKWVVCSAGGGAQGEELIRECVRVAQLRGDVFFDIVLGPMSSLPATASAGDVRSAGRVVLHRHVEKLGQLHGSADVVVCSGGTNSLIEAMEGGAWIVSCPVQSQPEDEQFIQAARLAPYYPVEVVAERPDLGRVLDKVLAARSTGRRVPVREDGRLMFDGVERAAEIVRQCAA